MPESLHRHRRFARLAGMVTLIEAAGIAVYCVLLGLAALNSQGATASAPIIEIIIFAIFAVGMYLVARGLFAESVSARAPFFLTQVFVLIVAYTVFAGDGSTTKVVGVLIALLGVLGFTFGVLMVASEDAGDAEADPSDPPSTKETSGQ